MDQKPSCIGWQAATSTDGSQMDIFREARVS